MCVGLLIIENGRIHLRTERNILRNWNATHRNKRRRNWPETASDEENITGLDHGCMTDVRLKCDFLWISWVRCKMPDGGILYVARMQPNIRRQRC